MDREKYEVDFCKELIKPDKILVGISEDIRNCLIKMLELSKMCKGKVFFVRHGTTVEEERRKQSGESGVLTQTAETRLGEEGRDQIIETASKLKSYLGGKVIFVYPADGEEEGILGRHERINESLYLMLCEIYGIEDREYTREKLEELISSLNREYGGKIEFWKTKLLDTTGKIYDESEFGEKQRVLDSKSELTRKNLQVCANTAELLGSDKIKKCGENTNFVIVGHKAIKGGIMNSVFSDDTKYILDFDLEGGEIIDFDINNDGELHGKYCDHDGNENFTDYEVLYLKPCNIQEILNLMRYPLLHGVEDIILGNPGVGMGGSDRKVSKGMTIVLQNYINAYFQSHPEWYKEYLFSESIDLKLFCLGNLIKNKESIFLKKNLEKFIFDGSILSFLKKLHEIEIDTQIRGLINDLLTEKNFILGGHKYTRDILQKRISDARNKSLDIRVAKGIDIKPVFNIDGSQFHSGNLLDLVRFDNLDGKCRHIKYIEGKPGTGKSFLTCCLVEKIIENEFEIENHKGEICKVVPLYINLSGVRSLEHLKREIDHIEKSYINNMLFASKGNKVYILDGLDESGFKYDRIKMGDLFGFLGSLNGRVVITSRTGYRDVTSYGLTKKMLDEFSEEQIDSFIQDYFHGNKSKIEKFNDVIERGTYWGVEKKSLKSVGSNPLILTMICEIVDKDNLLLELRDAGFINNLEIGNKVGLYEKIIALRLYLWNKGIEAREIDHGIEHLNDRIELLSKIAFDSLVHGIRTDVKYIEGIKTDKQYRYVYGKDFESLNLIFRRSYEGIYDFVHESLREYFAMNYLVMNIDDDEIFDILIDKIDVFGDNTIEWFCELLIHKKRKKQFFEKYRYVRKSLKRDLYIVSSLNRDELGFSQDMPMFQHNFIRKFSQLSRRKQKILINSGGIIVLEQLFQVDLLSPKEQNREVMEMVKFYEKEGKSLGRDGLQHYQDRFHDPTREEYIDLIVGIVKELDDSRLLLYLVERSKEDNKIGNLLKSSLEKIKLFE